MSEKSTAASKPLRCPWAGIEDPLYARYHDEEWGVPHADDRRLFEKLVLEGFQSGLSWLTILKKRENFRKAFDGFDPERVARYTQADVKRLMADAGIVRHLAKIEAAIDNARAFERLARRERFASFIWRHAPALSAAVGRASFADVPAQTEASKALSKALKNEGFRFVGPTTAYAFMQSVGMVNDHLVGCHRHAACAGLQTKFHRPAA